MIVLRICEGEGVWTDRTSEIAEADRCDGVISFPCLVNVGRLRNYALLNYLLRKPELAVKLQSSRLNDQGAGVLSGAFGVRDDPECALRRARLKARFRPVGPAPTIKTGNCMRTKCTPKFARDAGPKAKESL